ncbi:PaaI family thioesterase [Streptomyces sp. NPDC005423]|uniref:PaaI family thioesterase n=1 Tax=Streptomyces sp. NPDC005423 TaxID=3155343 RepID=UPI0033A131FB
MGSASTHFERLTRCCLNCRISRFLNKTIEIQKPGVARVAIPFHGDLTQNADFLHAAMLFEVGDTAGFMAANSLEETYSVLTVDYHINLIRPVRAEGIYAVGEVITAGKTIYVARSDVYSDSGKLVAAGQGTYTVSKILLTDLDGYAD